MDWVGVAVFTTIGLVLGVSGTIAVAQTAIIWDEDQKESCQTICAVDGGTAREFQPDLGVCSCGYEVPVLSLRALKPVSP